MKNKIKALTCNAIIFMGFTTIITAQNINMTVINQSLFAANNENAFKNILKPSDIIWQSSCKTKEEADLVLKTIDAMIAKDNSFDTTNILISLG